MDDQMWVVSSNDVCLGWKNSCWRRGLDGDDFVGVEQTRVQQTGGDGMNCYREWTKKQLMYYGLDLIYECIF